MKDERKIYLELGSNINPEENLSVAINILKKLVRVERISTVWETPAVGTAGPNFLNLAVQIRSGLQPDALKELILRNIEAHLGRKRATDKSAPRTIDIDIVIIDGIVVDEQLWDYAHLALPLAELIPDLVREGKGETLQQASHRLLACTPDCRKAGLLID